MTHSCYRLSFLLSILIFLILGMGIFSLLDIEKKLQAPKKKNIVKVALLNIPKPVKQIVSKPIVPIVPKKIVPPPITKKKPKPKKILKKHKSKKVRKIHKKVIKKYKPKKTLKRVVKKHKPRPKKIHKKIVKKYKTKPKQVFEEIIVPQQIIEAPMRVSQPIIRTKPKIVKHAPRQKRLTPITDNGRAKKAFLQEVRNRIIANKKYPRIALRRHIESSVKVRFDITTTGQVNNIRFISGKRIFYKSIKKTLAHTFPITVPYNIRNKLPIYDVSVVLHFNIR